MHNLNHPWIALIGLILLLLGLAGIIILNKASSVTNFSTHMAKKKAKKKGKK